MLNGQINATNRSKDAAGAPETGPRSSPSALRPGHGTSSGPHFVLDVLPIL
jgi:hypothetical protein